MPAAGRCTTTVTFVDDGVALSYSGIVTGASAATASVAATVDPPVVVTSLPVFPSTPDGVTTAAKTVALVNDSDAVVQFGTMADAPVSAMIFTATACLGRRLGPGASCTVRVAYRPGNGAPDIGRLSIPVVAGPATVVTARGTARPRTVPATTVLDFGTVLRGRTATRSVTYRNMSSGPSTFSSASVTGVPYRTASDTCSGTVLPAGGSCTVAAVFAPRTSTFSLYGTVTAVIDARTTRVQLTASTPAPLLIATRALDFGNVAVGAESAQQDIVVTNVAPGAVPITARLVVGLSWRYEDRCSGVTLAVGASCRIGVAFAPDRPGHDRFASLGYVNNQALGVLLTGRAVTGPPAEPLLVSPRGFDFGAVEVGEVPPSRTVTITNPATRAVTVTGGPAPTGEVRRTADGCTGATLAPGATCQVSYTLVPASAPDPYGRTFTETWNGQPYAMTLYALTLDRLQVVPGRPQFGAVELGRSARTTVEIRNVGSASVPLTGPLPFSSTAPHRVVSDGCTGHVLAPGEQCPVTLEVTPRRIDDLSAAVTGRWNGQDLSVFLDIAPIPWLAVDAAEIHFPRAPVGTPAAARVVTLTNVSGTARTITGHCIASRGFDGDDCHDATLAPGQSLPLAYRPSPFAVGAATGTVTVSAPTTGVRTRVALTALALPRLTVPTRILQLGPEPVGGEPPDEDIWVVNTSTAAASPRVTVAFDHDPDVRIVNDCNGIEVAPSAACALHVRYRPTRVQHSSLELRVHVDGVVSIVYARVWAQ